MALTVTGGFTGASASVGLLVAVQVLRNAASPASQPGAIFAAAEATHSPSAPITPVATGSVVLGCADWGPNTAIGSPTSDTASIIDSFATATIGAAAWRSNLTSASVLMTPGSASPSGLAAGDLAMAEIRNAGSGNVTVDGSTPAAVHNATALSLTTASFSPPAGSLLACLVTGYDGTGGTIGATVSDSMGLTWTQLAAQHDAGQGVAAVFATQFPPAGRPLLVSQAVQRAASW